MSVNVNKSVCLRIGQGCYHECNCIRASDGHEIAWSDTMRYLGVYITSAGVFTCCLSYAKHLFYRAFNAVFAEVANAASKSAVVELFLKTVCVCFIMV